MLSSSSVADGATNVSRDATPQLNFSTGIDPATAIGTNLSLTHPGAAATLSFAVAGSQVTLTPSKRLLPGSRYTLGIGTGVRGMGGEQLTASRTLAFTTADAAWRTATLVETDDTGSANSSQITFDGNGNAIAVWQQFDGARWNIVANRYTASSGWGTAVLIETGNAGDAQSPQIAFDGSGNAIAVWQQFDGTRSNAWANRYIAGSGWGTATLIETDNAGNVFNPQIAVNNSGSALAVWQQHDGTHYNIWANNYTAGSGWGTATLIETDNAGDTENPQIAFDGSGNGNGIAVWQQFDGTRTNIWANNYTAGSGWGTAALIETDNAGNAANPQIALDGNGNGIAVWEQYDGAHTNIWARRFAASSGWDAAALIETDNAGDAAKPQIAFDGSGNAVAVWQQSDGTRQNIWANRFAAGNWGTAALIETDDVDNASNPQLAIDIGGNAVAVWQQHDGTRWNIWANRYTLVGGWGTAALIEANNAGSAENPQVAIDGSGNALAVWQQQNAITRSDISANQFD